MAQFALRDRSKTVCFWTHLGAGLGVTALGVLLLGAPASGASKTKGSRPAEPPTASAKRAAAAAGISFDWTGDATLAQGRAEVKAHPAKSAAYLALAGAAWRQGDLTAAARTLETGRAKATRPVPLLIALGSVYADQGRLDDAEKATRDALAGDPRDAGAQYQLGVLQTMGHKDEEAVASFQQALSTAPDHAAAQSRLVETLAAAGHASAAEETCRKFLDASPKRVSLWISLGEALEAQRKEQEAFAAYGKALSLDPKAAGAHSRRARLFCGFSQYEAAQFECRAALSIDPQDPLAHAYLGIACAHLGQKEEARREALRAQESGMQVEEVWDVIGR